MFPHPARIDLMGDFDDLARDPKHHHRFERLLHLAYSAATRARRRAPLPLDPLVLPLNGDGTNRAQATQCLLSAGR